MGPATRARGACRRVRLPLPAPLRPSRGSAFQKMCPDQVCDTASGPVFVVRLALRSRGCPARSSEPNALPVFSELGSRPPGCERCTPISPWRGRGVGFSVLTDTDTDPDVRPLTLLCPPGVRHPDPLPCRGDLHCLCPHDLQHGGAGEGDGLCAWARNGRLPPRGSRARIPLTGGGCTGAWSRLSLRGTRPSSSSPSLPCVLPTPSPPNVTARHARHGKWSELRGSRPVWGAGCGVGRPWRGPPVAGAAVRRGAGRWALCAVRASHYR